MRKQIALILAVAVMLCMPVRAAAESTTITTVVPEPAYQMTIPADIQMEYRAGSCTIGVPYPTVVHFPVKPRPPRFPLPFTPKRTAAYANGLRGTG